MGRALSLRGVGAPREALVRRGWVLLAAVLSPDGIVQLQRVLAAARPWLWAARAQMGLARPRWVQVGQSLYVEELPDGGGNDLAGSRNHGSTVCLLQQGSPSFTGPSGLGWA
jgi:hypothetical protein